jgi:anti-sigma-K factor RskA
MSDLPGRFDELAAEYVMGVLEPGEMLAVREDALTERGLADAIAAWERRLAPLADLVMPVAPPASLWQRLDAATADTPPVAEVVPMRPRPAAAPASRPARPSMMRRPGFWQATTAAALALAAAFAGIAFLPREAPPASFAALAPLGAPQVAFTAEARPDGVIVVSAIAPAAVPSGRDLELWLLTPGSARPASLGVLPAGGKSITLDAPPPEGSQLLVSLEPSGGSPTGQPTGQVLYGGKLSIPSHT